MKRQIIIALVALIFFFTDINDIKIIYLAIVLGYVYYMLKNKWYNELALALPLFGYSFGLHINSYTGIPNIGLILGLILGFLGYRMLCFYNGREKLNTGVVALLLSYSALFIVIFFSIIFTFTFSYQNFKIQLFLVWGVAYFFSLHTFDKEIKDFNFEQFLILVFLLFVGHFSLMKDDAEQTLSPYQTWKIYSVLNDGIRGRMDIISATRIAGAGALAFFIYLFDFERKKTHLLVLAMFFFVMIIICQTRQSVVSLVLPIGIYIAYITLKTKKSNFQLIASLLFIVTILSYYVHYLNVNGVESRIIKSSTGNSEEGTGREGVWAVAVSYINSDMPSVGFGNYGSSLNVFDYPHNIFLELYVEVGWQAILFLSIIIIYILFELYLIFFYYKKNTQLELFLILVTIYYFLLSQFSADFPRNMMFLYTFAAYLCVRHNGLLTQEESDLDTKIVEDKSNK